MYAGCLRISSRLAGESLLIRNCCACLLKVIAPVIIIRPISCCPTGCSRPGRWIGAAPEGVVGSCANATAPAGLIRHLTCLLCCFCRLGLSSSIPVISWRQLRNFRPNFSGF